MITVLHRGGYAQMITILHGGGPLGTPNSDYVIYARPHICINISSIYDDIVHEAHFVLNARAFHGVSDAAPTWRKLSNLSLIPLCVCSPERFRTVVAWNGKSLDVICLDVSSNISLFAFLTTQFANIYRV